MSDEEAIALIESRGSLTGLGPLNSFGRRAKVWQVTPDTVLKVIWEPVEPYMMELVSSQTSIPIPKIRRCIAWGGYKYLFMEYVEGSDLYEIWPSLSLWRRFMVAWTLRGYVHQLRAMELPNKDIPGPIQPSGAPLRCEGHYCSERGAGPFKSYSAMTAWYNGRSRLNNILLNPSIRDLSMIPEPTTFFDDSMPLVFTHGDISPNNIRLGKDGTVWLIDWESAGAYPQWFEYANMMSYGDGDSGWPHGMRWFIPLIAGWYRKQLSFLVNNMVGIGHYGFDGFD
jgi:serine/threonine protein kinase